ncbi:15212_t:CDS:1, partial [Racocetra persica]
GIMVIANEVRIALQRLKLIEKLILHRETPWLLSADEKKIKDDDSQVIKALKNSIRTSEIIKQKDQDIASLKVKIG